MKAILTIFAIKSLLRKALQIINAFVFWFSVNLSTVFFNIYVTRKIQFIFGDENSPTNSD